VLAPVLARFAMVVAANGAVYGRERGLGGPFLDHMRPEHLKAAILLAAALALVLAGLWAVPFFAVAVAVPVALRSFTRRWLGGITGDVLGAVNEVTETLLFALGACIVYGARG
jgi:adenosylcobinamide-GDP ribazoletransferase